MVQLLCAPATPFCIFLHTTNMGVFRVYFYYGYFSYSPIEVLIYLDLFCLSLLSYPPPSLAFKASSFLPLSSFRTLFHHTGLFVCTLLDRASRRGETVVSSSVLAEASHLLTQPSLDRVPRNVQQNPGTGRRTLRLTLNRSWRRLL